MPARGVVAGGSAVVVDGPSGAPREFSGEEIEGAYDVETHTATLRANAGEAGEPIGIPKSLSVEGLIRLAGGEPAATGYITVPRPNGTVAYLRLADLPGPPEGPASFWVDQGCTHFFRPAIGAGANAEDNIASCGASLAVGVKGGAILAVAATASPSTASAGQAIEFTATATGAEPGEELSYVWNFGDGTSAAGTTVDHPFAAGGSYRVRVTATGTDESGGESAPLTVVVGSPPAGAGVGAGPEAPKAKTKPRGTGGRKGTGANGGGKDGRVGTGENGNGGKGRNGGKGAGAGKGTAGGKGNGAEGSDGTAAGAPGLNGGADESGAAEESDPTAEPAPTTEPFPIPEPPPSEASPFSEVPLPEPVSPPASPEAVVPPPAQAAAPTKSPSPDASVRGRTVRGQLVADLFEAGSSDSGAGGSTADPASESFASAPPAGGGSIPVAALAAAALLAAGVLFEWRRRPGRGLR